jgi:carboxypeptidase D
VLDECNAYEKINDAAKILNPCFDIYNIGRVCPTPADVLTADSPWKEPYFNRTAVKQALHVPLTAHWKMCTDIPVIANFSDKSPPAALTSGPLQRVIEKTNNVVVAHGTLDMILMLNGTLATLQNLTWNGRQGFTTGLTNPFYVPSVPMATIPSGSGKLGHWVSERGLTLSTVELSGHEVPEYQPAAAFRHLQLLLGLIPNLSEEPIFTTHQSPSWSRNELIGADCD